MPESEVVVVLAPSISPPSGAFPPGVPGEDGISGILSEFGVTLAPMFDAQRGLLSAPSFDGGAAGAAASAPDPEAEEMARYYHTLVADEEVESFVERMKTLPEVETVYTKPPTYNPVAPFDGAEAAPAMQAAANPAGPVPSFAHLQGYLSPAPVGIGATGAWNRPGGFGDDVAIIDIEGAWQFSHRDLQPNGGLVGGTLIAGVDWRNHGTAVMGEIIASHDGTGVDGIAPGARMAAVSHGGIFTASAIDLAAAQLQAGDILLLEMHRPGPRYNYASRNDQKGFIAIEWWRDDFLAIRSAIKRGIIVVEAAGNGAENLDDDLYDVPSPDFPSDWQNPFKPGADSGAIIVGAGAPPSGNFGPARSRLGFSNHGDRVDCQGWGREVVTTGYGDLYSGSGEDEWYTDSFSGTSSASPIVTGTIAVLQGIAKAAGSLLAPLDVRARLRATGTPQQAGPTAPLGQRIGSQPDLEALIASL